MATVKFKKWESSKVEGYKEKLLRYIEEHHGVYPSELQEEVKPWRTRPIVHARLKELIRSRHIYKVRGKYYAQDSMLGNIYNFARHMRKTSHSLIPPTLMIGLPAEESEEYSDSRSAAKSLSDKIREGVLDNKYYRTNFGQEDSSEKQLFEVVNMIGGFIVYIFIEAVGQYCGADTVKLSPDRKEELASRLIERAIDIPKVYERFLNSLLISTTTKKRHVEYNTAVLRKLTTSFRNVYPGIYDGLEQWWSDSINMRIVVETDIVKESSFANHKHHWERFKIYKKDRHYFLCRGCGHIVNKKI